MELILLIELFSASLQEKSQKTRNNTYISSYPELVAVYILSYFVNALYLKNQKQFLSSCHSQFHSLYFFLEATDITDITDIKQCFQPLLHIKYSIFCVSLDIFNKWDSTALIYPAELAFISQNHSFCVCACVLGHILQYEQTTQCVSVHI